MTFAAFLHALSQVDALIATAVAGTFVSLNEIAVRRRGVPSRQRLMEALLSATLLWVLCVRFAITAFAVLLAPEAILGPGVPSWGVLCWSGTCSALALVGWYAHRGSVPLRVTGAVVLALAAVVQAILSVFVLDVPVLAQLDNGLAIVVAAATLVFAAFHWTHRTATPNPLGGDSRPLDY